MAMKSTRKNRGRHRSTCKDGRSTIQWLESLDGVNGVVIGRTRGRVSVGAGKPVGYMRLQRQTKSGFNAVLQCSYGAQEIFIIVENEMWEAVKAKIEDRFPK